MVPNKGVIVAVSAFVVALSALAAQAEEALGKRAYMENCASCHGESGKGQGPLAQLLTVEVPGLTTLSADNDGVFPMLEVIQAVDGRTGVRGHEGLMPIWGDAFGAAAANAGPYGAEVIIRGKVLSLAYYLESIQE